MVTTGYTRNGIKETCRFDVSKGGYCKRHVRHSNASDKNVVASLNTLFPIETVDFKYKITHDGLYANNCPSCSGSGAVNNSLCPSCSGNGWDGASEQFLSLDELKNSNLAQPSTFLHETKQNQVTVQKIVNSGTKFLPYQLGDLVKVDGIVDKVKNLHTQYGVTVMVAFITEKDERVVFFTKNKWVNKIVAGSNVSVKGYIKDFKTYDGKPQTILKQTILA